MPQRNPSCQAYTAGLRAFHNCCLFSLFVKAALRARWPGDLLCFSLTSVLARCFKWLAAEES